MKKRKYLINDHVIYENICNLACKYCLAQDSHMKVTHKFQRKADGRLYPILDSPYDYLDQAVGPAMDKILNKIEEQADIPILKVSGGEVLLIKNLDLYLEDKKDRYRKIQLLTNGVMLSDELIDKLSQIHNFELQLSLDSHCLEGNSYRVNNAKMQDHLLRNLEAAVKHNISVDISCVLTDRSIKEIYNYAKYLQKYAGKVQLIPFPVRGSAAETFFPKDLTQLKKIINEYESFQEILPPLPYLERLLQFIMVGKKDFRCSVSRYLIGTFNDGYVSMCALGWEKPGNLNVNTLEEIYTTMEMKGLTRILLAKTPKLSYCKGCFSPYDMLSMYVNGELSINDMKKISLYNDDVICTRIQELKEEICNYNISEKLW